MKKRKIATFFLILIVLITISNTVFGFDKIWQTGKNWLSPTSTAPAKLNTQEGYEAVEQAVNIMWGVGIFAVLIGGVVLGIKYMTVGGVEEKAEVKKQMMPYIIGTAIIMGALTIWKLAIEFLESF